MDTTYLKEALRLPTSGARAVERFVVEGEAYLAIPQLAEDLPQTEPNINGGNSNTTVLLYRRAADTYIEQQRLPSPGGEDAEFFSLESGTSWRLPASVLDKAPISTLLIRSSTNGGETIL